MEVRRFSFCRQNFTEHFEKVIDKTAFFAYNETVGVMLRL